MASMSNFFARRAKKNELEPGEVGSSEAEGPVSDETKRKVDAAKSYIENMYHNKQQNMAQRSTR